ncbi:MAG TPA: ATP-binding protein [Gemmatimonadaceae bacterium]|nr:ATP-binding protein [Gemmatimonadaceae bacterium]
MRVPGAIRRRLRRSSLSVKLAALGAGVTAAVVTIAFVALGVDVRASTRAAITQQLARNQRTLQQLQQRSALDLLYAASLVARRPEMLAAMSISETERNAGGAPRAELVNTVEEQLREGLRSVNADLLLATDDSGRVFAEASASGGVHPVAPGTSLIALGAVRHALDPDAPADTGSLAVLKTDSGYVEVAVYPVTQGGFTLGALVIGKWLDARFIADVSATSDADVVLQAGTRILGASDPALRVSAAALRPDVVAGHVAAERLAGAEYVAAPVDLGETQTREAVRLWILQPLSARVAMVMAPVRRDFLLYGAIAVLIAALGAMLVARTVLGPFKRFVRHMRSGAAAEEQRAVFEATDEALEVRTLNDSFNQLMASLGAKRRELEQRTAELTSANVVLTDEISERVRVEQALRESEAQLRQSQKLEAIGTLAGGIAHDFNNLITVISGYTQLALMRAQRNSPEAEDLRQVIEASDRAANLTHQLLAFSRKQVLQPTVLDPAEVVAGIAPMLRRIIGEHIELRIETAGALARVRADRGQLEQVLLNLAVNARDAMPGGGVLTIATRNVCPGTGAELGPDAIARDGATGVALVVTDTGTGMPDEVKERIFEPFFTTKEAGKGTGLGLSTVYGIVNQSGGTIAVESELGHGTTFTITLPAADMLAAASTGAAAEVEMPRGTETILVVEDAEDVRILARRTLEERGYTVRVARNAAEALEISHASRIDVLLTDIVMPQMSGPQLVARYRARGPMPLVIYMSGYADDALAQYELEPGAVFLRKPFSPAVLARTVRDAIDGAGATAGASHAVD